MASGMPSSRRQISSTSRVMRTRVIGAIGRQRAGMEQLRARGRIQRFDRQYLFVRDSEAFARGRQHAHPWAAGRPMAARARARPR
jgi:hypothetical protein